MALANMKVFNDFLYSSMTETIDQQVRLFNAASGGTLLLQSGRNVGDINQEASFELISGLMRRRNANGSGTLTPVDLSQLQRNTIKVAGGTVPVRWEPQQFDWIQRNQEEAGTVIGVQVAEGLFQDHLNSAVTALVTAIGQKAALVHDGTAGTATISALVNGAAKFGDRATSLRAWLVHSKAMHDLFLASTSNAERLFEFGTVNISQDGFGRRFIMTDSPALVTPSSVDTYHTVGLVEGGAIVEDNGDFNSETEVITGGENIVRQWQAEYTFNLGLKGYSWNFTNGGASPTDAAIGTAANWDQVATSDKDTAGVLVNTQ